MTKLRPPVSIEDTLMRVLGELGIERAAEVTDRSESYLRGCTDPDRRELLSVRDLELLDLEHRARFGRGFPIFEALGRRLETARAERFADAAAIGRHAVEAARENGEACAALFEASLAPGDPRALEAALRETEDVVRVGTATIATIRAQLARQEEGSSMPPPADSS